MQPSPIAETAKAPNGRCASGDAMPTQCPFGLGTIPSTFFCMKLEPRHDPRVVPRVVYSRPKIPFFQRRTVHGSVGLRSRSDAPRSDALFRVIMHFELFRDYHERQACHE